MDIIKKTLRKHINNLLWVVSQDYSIDKMLDNIEDEAYEMLEYVNKCRKKRGVYRDN